MTSRRSVHTIAGIAFCLLTFFTCHDVLAVEGKRVLMLHSFGKDFKPWSEYAQSIRAELQRQSPWPLEIVDHSLTSALSGDEDSETPFVEYLRALFTKRPLDLIVSIGAPAAAFVQRRRASLFADTPMVFTAVDQRRIQYSILTENDVVVSVRINYLAAIQNILNVLPDTKNVMIVVGASPIEKFWKEEIAKEIEPLVDRVKFSWTDQMSFDDLLRSSSQLPPQTAIFWELMIVDAAGVVHEGSAPLSRLHAVAKVPIFSYDESFFTGREIVGGPLLLVADSSVQTASAAVRILGGEKAGAVKIPPVQFAKPRFDWQAMQRWGISESRLPPGSEIYFRDPTIWDHYRAQILGAIATLLLQAALISWLIYEHRRRHLAEVQSRNAMTELTYMNRRASAGELSASIAHEVNQPLTGIVTRANAALRWLRAETPNLENVGVALEQIVVAGHRAGEVVASVRAMFRRDTSSKLPHDINGLILEVLSILRIDLQNGGVELQTQLDENLAAVEGDKVQLQQVVLNLVMNAIEAMQSVRPRVLRVKSEQSKPDMVHISFEDTGTGIDSSNLDRIFSAMFTTKEDGMGMGLSICRSIIENHNGRIWASSGLNGGTILQFELPATPDKARTSTMEASASH